MSKVLVVDDHEAVRTALSLLFELHDLDVIAVGTAAGALAAVRTEDVGVVVQDMNLGDSATSGADGIALFREIRSLDPGLPVILITAWTSLETAVELVREGAADYMGKPWDDAKLVLGVQNLMRLRAVSEENARLRGRAERERVELGQKHELCGLVYKSPALHQAVSLAVQVARADVPVLVTGPNGAGKEKIAEIIHASSGATRSAVGQGQRRRLARAAARGRAVRRRGGRVHRRDHAARRPLRGGPRRHAVPRRDRQPVRRPGR